MADIDEIMSERLYLQNGETDEAVDVDAVTELLATPYDKIFKLSGDGKTYVRPVSLFGVPVEKMEEQSAYWDDDWFSLNAYLDREADEERRKHGTRRQLQHENDAEQTAFLIKCLKGHTDNVTKHRKIRNVFGRARPHHPNQLASKALLPETGLCEQEIMYILGCKMTGFQYLADRGKMAMGAWDFVRWRIGRALLAYRAGKCVFVKNNDIKAVIRNIISRDSIDPLFRQAILYAARLDGRGNSYRSTKVLERSMPKPPRPARFPRSPISASSQARVARSRSLLTASHNRPRPTTPTSQNPESGMPRPEEAPQGVRGGRARTGARVQKKQRARSFRHSRRGTNGFRKEKGPS
ncbi:hypothetical protein GMORB2_4479 [Geosmithia morbida]|uniref:Uncharacterized protein n=1 Tax=Geosmithia morbida TaxID=1094350 RepID=A0A9P4YMR0_9HYPO|nr:uncharacterized protein GMORB2_4479 [Geosmithia morbida]KAF4119813.1 hypothetical protein GMORB2_4479 [Geosmithia morbida]